MGRENISETLSKESQRKLESVIFGKENNLPETFRLKQKKSVLISYLFLGSSSKYINILLFFWDLFFLIHHLLYSEKH